MRGHRESVKNLLEIFEGLMEYLMEEMSEESQNGGGHQVFGGGIRIALMKVDQGRRSGKK